MLVSRLKTFLRRLSSEQLMFLEEFLTKRVKPSYHMLFMHVLNTVHYVFEVQHSSLFVTIKAITN